MKKRIISLLLSAIMLFSLLPTTAMAGDGIAYIERSWNGNEVAKADRNCTSYSVVSSGSKTWNAGWYVVNANTTISSAITVSGDVHLILCDNVTLTAQKGIVVNGKGNNSLTIYGQSGDTGKLVATGATDYPLGAGIGGVSGDIDQNACGTVIIHGGMVSATGEYYGCVGIGGMSSNVGTVTVYGGKVTATGKSHGAGIGGTVTVYGGEVTANGNYDAGINGDNNTVTIFGGTIKATSNEGESIRGKVTVNGGAVTAISNGGTEGTGIGGSALTVNGGTVTATGKNYGAGIGSSAVAVNGGKVTATGGEWGPGISGGTLTVTGGEVFATGRDNCAGIADAVTVNGGKVTAVGGNSNSPAGISGDVSFGEDFVGGVRAGASEDEAVYMTKATYASDHSAHYVTMPVDAPTVATIVETETSYDSVQAAIDAADDSQTVRMEKDVTENLSVAGSKSITLDLNGKVLTGNGNGSVVVVNGTLTLADSAPTAMHDNESLPAGGVITGGTGSYVEEFVIGIGGGGVYVSGEAGFTMTGGTITGNSARYGGGVYVSGEADFTMTGGTITENTVFESGEFGGEPAGGGVYFKAPGIFERFVTLGGTAKIIENSGSNLYLGDGSAIQIREYGDNAPAQGMSVGVTTEIEPYEGTPVTFAAYALSTDAKYFFADNEDYAVAFGYDDMCGGDCLQLVVPQAEDYYPVRIGDTKISRFNKDDVLRDGGSVSFDPETNTLTLNNMAIGTDAESSLREAIKSELPAGKTLTVKLIGTNVIGRAPDEEYEEYTVKTGLFIGKGMTKAAAADGSLLLIGDKDSSLTIYASGDGISSGDTSFGEDGKDGKKFEGELKIYSDHNAIESPKSVFANGGKIFMESQNQGIRTKGDVTVSDGELTIRAEGRGISASEAVTVSGGKLDVTGGEDNCAIFADGGFSITSTDCQIIARGSDPDYGAIYSGSAPSFVAGLTMLGSTDKNAAKENITATAQMVASEEEYPYGAYIGTEPAKAVTFKLVRQHTTHDEIEFQPWVSADHEGALLPNVAGSWYLTDDVTVNTDWNVPEGTTNLCLNGKMLSLSSCKIKISESATLNLYDCGNDAHEGYLDTYHLWTHGTGGEGTTAKTIYGGIIYPEYYGEYNNKTRNTVQVDGAFNMYGGTIAGVIDTQAQGFAAAIVGTGHFAMYGGTITGNSSQDYMVPVAKKVGIIDIGTLASVTIGKDAVIDENYIKTYDYAKSAYSCDEYNLVIPTGKTITLGTGDYAPTEKMCVGIRSVTAPALGTPVVFTGANAGENDASRFESNAEGIHIERRKNNALYLCVANEPTYVPHECVNSKQTVTGQAATCTADGWKDHYKCTTCEALYADETMTNEITDLEAWKTGDGKLGKTGHDWTYAASNGVITATCRKDNTHTTALTLTATSPNYSGNTPVIQLGTDTEKSAWEGAGLAALDAANLKYYKSTGEGSTTRANDIELSVSTLGTGNYVAEYTLGDAVAKVAFAIAGNISLDNSTENGYVFIKDPDDTGEYYPLNTDENVSIGSDKIKIYTVPAYGYKLDKITVSYGDNSTDYEDGCVVDLPQDKDVTIFASFEPISISVELSDHTKGLLKKLIELTGDSEEQAVETVSYYLADSDWTAYNSIEKMLSEGCQIPEEEFSKYIKAQFYMVFLETSFSLNGFALEENAGLDQLKCIINEIPPVVYKALDLCDSIRERDYENTIVLASEVEEDGLYTYNKVLGYEWDSEDALDERDFLNAVKNYLTDNAVSGDLFTNPKDASEKYAEYIAKLCGLTDSVSISKFKQYADEWAIDEGNQYMLNYFGNLLSEEEFLDLTEEEKQNYVDKALTGMCLSMFDSFKWNHFAKDGEHFSADKSECTFVDIMRESLDILVAHKESMINLINICDLYYGKKVYDDYEDSEADYYDEDNKMTPEGAYHYINGYFNEILDAFSAELYTDWDNLYKTIQGENVVSSAFEVTDSDSGRTIKLLKDISFARLGQNPETLVIGEDNSIILDLNGHKINRNLKVATENGSVIIVNGQLSVIDTSSEGTGKITGGNTTGFGGGIYVSETGDFSMTGGSICENTACDGGAGLYVAGTAMLGGTAKIKNNIKRSGMDESANNVLLADGKMLNIGTGEAAPATGMEIHVQGGIDKVIVNSGATESDTNYFHADDSSKRVLFDNGKLKIGIPKDTWTYSAEAAVLTASCNGECGTAGAHTVTLTLTATSANYSGSAVEATMDKTAWEAAGLTAPTVVYEAKTGSALTDGKAVNAGSYTAKITVAGKTATKDFEITKASQEVPATGVGYTINYTDETITAGTDYEVSTSNTSFVAPTDGKVVPGNTYYVRKKGNDNYNPSSWTSITVAARPTAPSGYTAVDPTTVGGANAKITGVTTAMEYSTNNGTSWTAVSGTEITGLSAGKVLLRVKATSSAFASINVEITLSNPHAHAVDVTKKHVAVPGTCKTKGTKEWYECTDSSCDKKLDKNGNELTSIELDFDSSNHEGTATWTKTATTHKETYNCCGAVKTAENSHISSGAATEESAEVCTVCGYELAEKLPHTHKYATAYSKDATGHWHAATCGHDVKDGFAVHTSSGAATEDAAEVCTVCGYEIAPKLNHNHTYATAYSKDATGHWHAATCGHDVKDGFAAHTSSGAATEDAAEVCTVCGYEIAPKLNHNHTYATAYSKDATGHWHAATCGHNVQGSFSVHTYGDWTVTKLATITKAGEKQRTCSVCGYKEAVATTYDKPVGDTDVDPNAGKIENKTDSSKNGCAANVEITKSEIIEKLELTPEELSRVENGEDIAFYLVVTTEESNIISQSEQKEAEKKLESGEKIGQYLDINLFKIVGNDKSKVSQTNGKIKIEITIPSDILKVGTDFFIIRVHNGVATRLALTLVSGDTYSFETDQFSTYAIGYKEKSSDSNNDDNNNNNTNDDMKKEDSDTNNSDNKTEVTVPQTGDSNDLRGWFFALIVLIVLLGGILVLVGLKRKEKASK